VIIAAALCPAPPLLVRELTGADLVLPELRQACLATVAELQVQSPDVIAVVGAAAWTRTYEPDARLDLGVFAPGLGSVHRASSAGDTGPADGTGGVDGTGEVFGAGEVGGIGAVNGVGGATSADGADRTGAMNGIGGANGSDGADRTGGADQAGSAELPSSVGLGARLLCQAGYQGLRILRSIGYDEPPDRCAAVGAELATAGERVALLVMADGSARRGLRAPGHLDPRSAGFDAEVERAVRAGDARALLAIDQELARELMATGRPAWQVLAGALGEREVTAEVRYCDDPFGVAYLVASLRVPQE
jgi:hypothetical protein